MTSLPWWLRLTACFEGFRMKKVILYVNPRRDRALAASGDILAILADMGCPCAVCTDEAALGEECRNADMLITLGGDGTILHAARAVAGLGTPILGVNLGKLGFMAELELSEKERVRDALSGSGYIESRMMADVSILRDGGVIFRDFALNEAVVGGVARVISIEVLGDGRRIMGFDGDGVIVSTPTGSTAYSMSAGGPIVEPDAGSLIVTPVCPHVLSARPYVLSPERSVEVAVLDLGGKTAYLSVDGGESFQLLEGDRVEITRSALTTRLVRGLGAGFYEKVSKKFGEGS